MKAPIELRCPTCGARPGQKCMTMTAQQPTGPHKARANDIGWTGRDEKNRQQCDRCGKWQYPAIHSCTGVRQDEYERYAYGKPGIRL